MTQERLRELLSERVADETMADYSGRAWEAARGVRRRHRLGAAAGLVAATVGVWGGIAVLYPTPPQPPPDHGITDGSERPDTTPDATYQGVPVWWSPDQHEEQDLPAIDSPLPADIDLAAAQPYVAGELARAVAAFARDRSVVLVGPAGELRTVDVSRLHKVVKPNGYSYFPTSTWMLTHDGTRLVFNQDIHQQAIFTIATGQWSTGTVAGPPMVLPAFDPSTAEHYGDVHGDATSWGMGVPLPVRDPGTDLADPEFLVAGRGDQQKVLAFTWLAGDGTDSRYKECCPVAGWLDDETVVYESRQSHPLLVAWRVGTHDFAVVSRIRGSYDVASFAL